MEASFALQSPKTTQLWAGLTIRHPGCHPAARLPADTQTHDHSHFLSLVIVGPTVPDQLYLNDRDSIASIDQRAKAGGWLLEMKISARQS